MHISSVTFGAEHSAQVERNLNDIEKLVARMEIAALDGVAAQHFGQLDLAKLMR